MKVTEVFTPGAFPNYTYVKRETKGYETQLRNAMNVVGQVISLAGPSKSGKTVLVEQVVGKENLYAITGAGVKNPSEVWDRLLDLINVPSETSTSTTVEANTTVSAEVSGEAGIPFLTKGSATGSGELGGSRAKAVGETRRRSGQMQVAEKFGHQDAIILIDDFHYMPRNVQEDITSNQGCGT